MRKIAILLAGCLAVVELLSQIPAFPGAEGFGVLTTTGGRGGSVYYVTNLNCSGPGSLNYGLSQQGARYIVFAVSGIIDCAAEIVWGDCYIAGQTSPGGVVVRGILLDDFYEPAGKARNVIIRHLNSRPGRVESRPGQGWVLDDALRIDGARDIVIDHCSLANAIDECVQLSRSSRVTLSNCMLSETLGYHYDLGGMLINYSTAEYPKDSISIHHNLWNRIGGRMPEISCEESGERSGDQTCLTRPFRLEYSNNLLWDMPIQVYYDRGFNSSNDSYHDVRANFIGNHAVGRNAYCGPLFNAALLSNSDNQLFASDNTMARFATYSDYQLFNCCNDFCQYAPNTEFGTAQRLAQRHAYPSVTYTNSRQLREYMVAQVGAFNAHSTGKRDPMNRRLLTALRNNALDTQPVNGTDYYNDAFTLDFTTAPAAPTDTDLDGMPDAWETARGLNPSVQDHNGTQLSVSVTGVAGYTNLECYLHLLSESLLSAQVVSPPTLTSFSPSSGGAGTAVLIKGANFRGATAVRFGGTAAASFSVVDSVTITAVVGAGSSGSVSVVTPAGTASLAGFTFAPSTVPTLSSFAPTSARKGQSVTIRGTHLSGATAVRFGAVAAASFAIIDATTIIAVVGDGATGSISVTTPTGTATLAGFTWLAAAVPTITSFSPASASSSQDVSISGTNFTGATAVRFGGVAAASFTVHSATSITARPGAGASGQISVTTAGGTASRSGFTYLSTGVPVIHGFSPTSARQGRAVLITGSNFTGATAVRFGGTPAASFVVLGATTIAAVVGTGASGHVEVTTSTGTASLAGFAFLVTGVPTISSFSPTSATTGQQVSISGTNFTGATALRFGGTPAASFRVVSPTNILATVGAGSSGSLSVTTPGGTASLAGFVFTTPPAPTLTSFSPASAQQGRLVQISGTNFTGATAVRFGGTPATSFVVNTPTLITAIVGAGASGSVSVATPGGTASMAGFTFTTNPAPTLTSFFPSTAQAGQAVLIRGNRFYGRVTVRFGGVVAQSATVFDSTTVVAVVGSGASGSISLSTASGTATLEGFTFSSEPLQRPGTAHSDGSIPTEPAAKAIPPLRSGGVPERGVPGGSFFAYPNPTEGVLHLQVQFDEATPGGYLRVSDSYGRELRRLGRVASGDFEFDLRGMAPGWYCVSLFGDTGRLLDVQRVVLLGRRP